MEIAREWPHFQFEEIETGDGSPSLKGLSPDSEPMHNRAGALSESRWIYGRLIDPSFQLKNPHFLSLGLGLGYNEILIAEAGIRTGQDWFCHSFEANEVLVEQFLSSLKNPQKENGPAQTYKKIFSFFKDSEKIRQSLLKAHQEKRWVIEGALTTESKPLFPIQAYLWDAFSQRTSPDLWNEKFLADFLLRTRDQKSAGFTTYACTGSLKRALTEAGFRVETQEGFAGKRNSTFATYLAEV